MRRENLPEIICEDCEDDLREYIEASATSFDGSVEPPPTPPDCQLCGKSVGDTYYSIETVRLHESIAEEMSSAIHGCDNGPCSEDPNSDLEDLFNEIIDGLTDDSTYNRLLKHLSSYGLAHLVELEGVSCGFCGYHPTSWHQEVLTESFYVMIPYDPELPKEIVNIAPSATDPADLIEYFRADCSNSLIHLTKSWTVEWLESNLSGRKITKEMSAPEILYIILATQELKASAGKGVHRPAVCFTEKPLIALKDMLLGAESKVRQDKRSIIWQPYGLMFLKTYLRQFGTEPVLPMKHSDERLLPESLRHRVTPFSDGSNFFHEREWRCGNDIKFNPKEAVVLVPRFEQIAPFRAALDRKKVEVRGFLPLLDLFAYI